MLAATLLCYFFSKMNLRRDVLKNIVIKHCLTTNHMSCNLYTHFYRTSAYWVLTRDIDIANLSVCLSVRPSLRYVSVPDEKGLRYRHSFFINHSSFTNIKHFHKITTGSPPAVALNTGGVLKFRDFLLISRYISQTIQDIAIVTMEGE